MTDLDQIARDSANKAIALIETHELVCTERQGHIIEGIKDLKSGVNGLYRRFWAAAVACISLLLGACSTLMYLFLRLPH